MREKAIFLLNGLLLAMLLGHSLYRDIQLEKLNPGDLRNRIVGARLQKDGRLPYHFQWQSSDGIRYYDPNNFRNEISNITASPFYHQLLYPICDLPQRTLSRIWLCGEYIMLALMIAMFSSLSNDSRRKWIILNLGIVFTCTEAWIHLISAGQMYFFIAFLLSCVFFGLVKKKKYGFVIAPMAAIMSILIAPFTVVFLIPVLRYAGKYIPFLITTVSGLSLHLVFIMSSPGQSALYKDYFSGMKQQVAFHQHVTPGTPIEIHRFSGPYDWLEGINLKKVDSLEKVRPVEFHSENGNIFVFYYTFFHKKISLALLSGSLLLILTALTLLFMYFQKGLTPDTIQILQFGFTLYLIAGIFSPVYRHQYYTTQWLPLLMAAILMIKTWRSPVAILLILGLFLNLVNFHWLPMRHTIGEYIWIIAILILSFKDAGDEQMISS